jgi:F-type H+-transporting ATPase subunit epsilon
MQTIHLKILLPSEILIDTPVTKIIAEAENGSFCIKPRHIDFVTSLLPGLVSYTTEAGLQILVGVDGGTLVKCASDVLISTREAVIESDPSRLSRAIQQRFHERGEHERLARSVLSRLEAGVARRFFDLQDA